MFSFVFALIFIDFQDAARFCLASLGGLHITLIAPTEHHAPCMSVYFM